jgi:hypothetical protein
LWLQVLGHVLVYGAGIWAMVYLFAEVAERLRADR